MVAHARRFNRAFTQDVGALHDRYLSRGRPLGAARVVWEIGDGGTAAQRTPKLPPAWFKHAFWRCHRALYRLSRGRFLWTPPRSSRDVGWRDNDDDGSE